MFVCLRSPQLLQRPLCGELRAPPATAVISAACRHPQKTGNGSHLTRTAGSDGACCKDFFLVQTADVCVFDVNGNKPQSGRAPSSDDPCAQTSRYQRTEARRWL